MARILTVVALLLTAATAWAVGPGPGPDWVEHTWRGVGVYAPPEWSVVLDSPDVLLLSYRPEGEGMENQGYTLALGLDPMGFRPEDFESGGDEVGRLGEVEISGLTVQLFEVRAPEMTILACHVTEPMPTGDYLGLAFGASQAMDREEYLPLFERMLYTVTIDPGAFAPQTDTAPEDDHGQEP